MRVPSRVHPILLFLLSLALSLSLGGSTFAVPSANAQLAEGIQALNRGQLEMATTHFQQAEQEYERLGNVEGVLGSRINRSQVLEQAGLTRQACQLLADSLDLTACSFQRNISAQTTLEINPDSRAQSIGLRYLARMLTQMGHYTEAEYILNRQLDADPHNGEALLTKLTLVGSIAEATLKQHPSAEALAPLIDQIQTTLPTLLNHQDRAVQTLAAVNALNLASLKLIPFSDKNLSACSISSIQTLAPQHQLHAIVSLLGSLRRLDIQSPTLVHALMDYGWTLAHSKHQKSQLLWQIGRWQETTQEPIEDIRRTYQAGLSLSQASDPYQSYHFLWALAKTYQDDAKAAAQLYADALVYLKHTTETIEIYPSTLGQLTDDIDAIFHEYMAILYQQHQPISQFHDQMNAWIIDAYLKCSQYQFTDPASEFIDDGHKINIIALENEIVVIVDDTHVYQSNRDIITQLKGLSALLDPHSPGSISDIQQQAQHIYHQLLEQPIQDHITPGQEIHFILDPELEKFPLQMLYDGHQYLIERYIFIYGNGHQQSPLEDTSALVSGISIPNETSQRLQLGALPEVEWETDAIARHINNHHILLNSQFTATNLSDSVNEHHPTIVHLATHAQFSTDPRNTFVLAWDQPLHSTDLGSILRQHPPNILVLSACETAQGGKLGLSGLAIQAGAHNIIASLQLADSEATFLLMNQLYAHLANNESASESLRNAQRYLIQSSIFNHPIYWATFISLMV